MRLELIEGNIEDKRLWQTLGWIVILLTLGLSFKFGYERFFERRLFLNKRILGDYIDEMGLPEPEFRYGAHRFNIDGYEITLNDKNKWYVFTNSSDFVMTNWVGDRGGRIETEYIRDELLKKVGKLYAKTMVVLEIFKPSSVTEV